MSSIKIGILGAGHLGKIHLRLLKEISQFRIIGFFEPDKEKAVAVENELGVTAFNSEEELLAQSDAVDIVTPTLVHHRLACTALRKAKHLFIEKPIAHTVKEAEEIIVLSDKAGMKVQIGHVERFNAAFLAVKDFFIQPMFIETHRLAQFGPRGTDVSVVLDLMIHDIDIALHVIKSEIKKIHASGVAVVSDSPDICNARIEFVNGAVANLTASRISLKKMRKSRFFQKDAYLSVDFLEKKAEVVRIKELKGESENPFAITIDLGETCPPTSDSNDSRREGKKEISFEHPQVENSNAIKMELESFADAILNNKEPVVTAREGCKALEVAFKVMEQMKTEIKN